MTVRARKKSSTLVNTANFRMARASPIGTSIGAAPGGFGERKRKTAKPWPLKRAWHPVHRALAGPARVAAEPRLTQKKLADKMGVAAATLAQPRQ